MPQDRNRVRERIELDDGQRAAASPDRSRLLVTGTEASGRTEALADRLAQLGESGGDALALTASAAGARNLTIAAERSAGGGSLTFECEPIQVAAARLLASWAAPGMGPEVAFLELLGSDDRIALLLDRIDELPLGRHQIRGNPGALLARLISRVDALKGEGMDAGRLRARAEAELKASTGVDAADAAATELEFADFLAEHDRIVREAGGIDAGEAVLALSALLRERPQVARDIAREMPHLVVDELEELTPAELDLVGLLAAAAETTALAGDPDGGGPRSGDGIGWARRELESVEEIALSGEYRHGEAIRTAARAALEDHPEPASSNDGEVLFWNCENERAEAQAIAREVEMLLVEGTDPEAVCVAFADPRVDRQLAAALEERRIPYRSVDRRDFLRRAEVRDVIAWLRLLADPTDSVAVVRAISRPPVELRSVDVARCTTIARRRKLDMVSALEAAIESPQIPPDARERIQAFLELYGAAYKAMDEMRPEVFVRRLIERIGLRRQGLFAAQAETAERLRDLARLDELASAWSRRSPAGSNREFAHHLARVAEADVPAVEPSTDRRPGSVLLAPLHLLKGEEFDAVFLAGLHAAASSPETTTRTDLGRDADRERVGRAVLYTGLSRARRKVVLSRPRTLDGKRTRGSAAFERIRSALGAEVTEHPEELFGPDEGLHAALRMVQEEALEDAWRAGGQLWEPRLDTFMEVHRAVARLLETVKLAALLQRRDAGSLEEAIANANALLAQGISDEQLEELERSSLDEYLLSAEQEREAHEELVAERREPSLEAFLPRRGDGGLALSATDIELYRTCPLKYKFSRVFGIPREQTINQRVGIAIHQVLERYHGTEGERTLERLMALFEVAWRRGGFGETDDELQYRDRSIEALRLFHERSEGGSGNPRWVERSFDFTVGPHHVRGRVDRVDELPGGTYELIDYKTGDPKPADQLADDIQLAVYRVAAREAWDLEAASGSYWYVLADEKVELKGRSDERERVEALALETATGIIDQDFEPRPSPGVCSWCEFKLVCPAADA